MTTIYDVARFARVSIATVSKALNGKPDVKGETKRMVEEAAHKLGYYPSRMARALVTRKTENIGVMALRRFGSPVFTNAFYAPVLSGIEGEMEGAEHSMAISVAELDERDSYPVPKMILDGSVDGIISVGWMPPSIIHAILERKIPCVLVDHYSPGRAYSLIVDNQAGMIKAAVRVRDRGHREVGFVGGKLGDLSFRERRDAWHQNAGMLGLSLGAELVAPENSELKSGDFHSYLSRRDLPDAVICANDDHALKLISAAAALGIRIPEDLGVTGFDDIAGASTARPPLSTVRVDKEALGAKAVKALFSILDKELPDGGLERVDVEWVERASV